MFFLTWSEDDFGSKPFVLADKHTHSLAKGVLIAVTLPGSF